MTAQGIRMKSPAHPGGFVKSEIVESFGLTVTRAAEVLGVTRPALSAFSMNGLNSRPRWRYASKRHSASRWTP